MKHFLGKVMVVLGGFLVVLTAAAVGAQGYKGAPGGGAPGEFSPREAQGDQRMEDEGGFGRQDAQEAYKGQRGADEQAREAFGDGRKDEGFNAGAGDAFEPPQDDDGAYRPEEGRGEGFRDGDGARGMGDEGADGPAERRVRPAELSYPIAELGGCASVEACAAYCDESQNQRACVDFGAREDMMNEGEARGAREFIEEVEKGAGPGGCRNEQECKTRCDNVENMRECTEFALAHNLIDAKKAGDARKMLRALEAGVGLPNGCSTKQECDQVCEDPKHMGQCVDFAEAAGLMDKKQARMMRETGGRGPGDCRGGANCEAFCSEPQNVKACMDFALSYELVPPQKAQEMRRIKNALDGGAVMPDCRSKQECEAYCSGPEHAEQCVVFAERAGYLREEQVEAARKVMEKGMLADAPGGCAGEAECERYCRSRENRAECIDFARRAELLSENEVRRLQALEGDGGPGGCANRDECRAYCEDPGHISECADFVAQAGEIGEDQKEWIKREFEGGGGNGRGGFAPPGNEDGA